MNAQDLRTTLLVKAVEEQDADGAILTLAERDAATREALRRFPARAADEARRGASDRPWRVLATRAAELYGRLVERHPVVAHAVTLENQAARATLPVLALGFLLGLVLSVLDSRVRIEILAFPLLGLVLWNIAVYLLLAVAALTGRRRTAQGAAQSAWHWVMWPARWGWRRASGLLRQASFYHRPLATALRRHADEWWPLAQPLLVAQGKRVFHLAAAAVALGLVTGFYVRGIALEYRAGWESTFLDAAQVRSLLHVIYGPAAALSGIVLPATEVEVERLHWRGGAGGGPAATWIHLVAVTALLFIVVPRLVLAAVATLAHARAARDLPVPDSLLPYARSVLGGSTAALPAVSVRVTPYACEPGPVAVDGLRRLLAEAYGPATHVEWRASVPYGEESAFERTQSGDGPDIDVMLLNLASTPETENHGAALAKARAGAERVDAVTRHIAIVDESSFLGRLGRDATLAARVDERRQAWREFVRRHGWGACLVDLEALARAPGVATELVEDLRRAGRA
jgi:hypothetical protein